MTTMANLRKAIEAMPHREGCLAWALSPPHAIDDSLCTCERRNALAALDELERERHDQQVRLMQAYSLIHNAFGMHPPDFWGSILQAESILFMEAVRDSPAPAPGEDGKEEIPQKPS